MDINVKISCPDLTLAAATLAKAILSVKEPRTQNPEPPASIANEAPSPAQPVSAAPVNPTPAGTPIAPAPAPTAPSSTAVPTSPAPQITGDMVAKAGADLIVANPAAMGPLNALLQKYAVGCAQELKPDQIGPFATEMRALGARI